MSIFEDGWDFVKGTTGDIKDGMFGKDANSAWDKSNFDAHGWMENPNYNPNDFNFGGGSAADAEFLARQQNELDSFYRQRGIDAQNRQLNENGELVNRETMGRNQVQDAVNMQKAIAEGNGPSQAPAVMQQGLNRAAAQQTAMAGGARGMGAMAMAQANGQANAAMMNQNSVADAARIKSQEQLAGAGMYGSLATGQRQMDQSRLAQNNQMQQFNRQSNDQYDIAQQQLAAQRAQEANRIRAMQQQGGIQRQQLGAQTDMQAQQMDKDINLYNTEAVKGRVKAVGGMLGGFANMGMNAATGGMGGSMGQLASGSGVGGGGGGGGGGYNPYDPGY